MPLHRMRFSIRAMMLAIAIIALFMGGGFLIGYLFILAVQVYHSRREVKRLGGSLRLQVVLPASRRLLRGSVVLCAVLLSAASVGYLVLIAELGDRHRMLTKLLFFSCACAGVLFWPWFWSTRVEFRERGIVHGAYFWPWESIWMWGWTSFADGFWLKLRHRFDTCRIASKDKEAIRVLLEEYLGTLKQRTPDPISQRVMSNPRPKA